MSVQPGGPSVECRGGGEGGGGEKGRLAATVRSSLKKPRPRALHFHGNGHDTLRTTHVQSHVRTRTAMCTCVPSLVSCTRSAGRSSVTHSLTSFVFSIQFKLACSAAVTFDMLPEQVKNTIIPLSLHMAFTLRTILRVSHQRPTGNSDKDSQIFPKALI